jgi:prolyl oligopeptidase
VQDLYSIVLREGEKGDEQVLLDPAALSADSSKSVRILDVSADGGLLAYSIQEGGEDEVEVGFFDLDERRPLADRLPRTRYFSVSVLPGDHSVYYAREAVAGEGGRLYLHRLGTDPATDREVFGDGYGRGTTVWANLSDDGRYLVAHALSATGQRVASGEALSIECEYRMDAVPKVGNPGSMGMRDPTTQTERQVNG